MRHADLKSYLEMAQDEVRVSAYKRAIDALCPGKVVLDLGAGPGILSHLALAAGARKVYAIDSDPVPLAIAASVAAEMGAADRFVAIAKRSRDCTRADLHGDKAEVLVSETFDVLGTGEGIVESMLDAAKRLCTPWAVMIPRTLEVSLALGTSSALAEMAAAWASVGKRWGLPYDALVARMPAAACSMPVGLLQRMTDWTVWQAIKLGKDDVVRHTLVPFTAVRTGHVDAILAAWRAELADGVTLSTFPEDPETHWKQGVVTMGTGLDVEAGRRYIMEMVFSAGSTRFGWAVRQVADDDNDPRIELVFRLGRAVELTA